MTVEEALYRICNVYANLAQTDSRAAEPYKMAIIALNKQIGSKPYKVRWDEQETRILCPQCNYLFYSLINGERITGNQTLYCPCCGQRIDWGEEDRDDE